MFGDVRGGNYGRVGQALAREQQALHAINAEASPDYGLIAKESIKGRSRERKAVTEAEARVHRAGLDSVRYMQGYKLKAASDAEVEKIKLPAKRFAGVVGAAGTLAGAALLKKGFDEDKADRLRREEEAKAYRERVLQAWNNAERGPAPELPPPVKYELPDLEPIPSFTPSAGPADTSGSGEQASVPGRNIKTRAEVEQLAIKHGFSPEVAKTVAAISYPESGWDFSNDTIKSGLNKRNGEDSVGGMQINWGYHKDKGWLPKVGVNKRSDLYDPDKNMAAAHYLYTQAGNTFTDWTTFTSGKYLKHLN